MGAKYEFNWYLVVDTKEKITVLDKDRYFTVKTENRIYPLNAPIPLIVKNKGCLGMVSISSLAIKQNKTEVEFTYLEKYQENDIIAQHYYEVYKRK